MYSLALLSFKGKFSKKPKPKQNCLSEKQQNRIYNEIIHCFSNPRQHQKASRKNLPMVKKFPFRKCIGILFCCSFFSLTLGQRTAGKGQHTKKKSITDCEIKIKYLVEGSLDQDRIVSQENPSLGVRISYSIPELLERSIYLYIHLSCSHHDHHLLHPSTSQSQAISLSDLQCNEMTFLSP